MTNDNCPFCDEFSRTGGAGRDRIITEFTDSVLVPTVGCFVPGYVLLIPKVHISSFAMLADDAMGATATQIEQIRKVIAETFSIDDVIVAEHGAVDNEHCGASCIVHAHLHFIPVRNKWRVLQTFIEVGGNPTIYDSFEALSELRKQPYIYLSLGARQHLVWPDTGKFQRQFVRRVCASHHGIGAQFNWRIFPFEKNAQQTLALLRNRFHPVAVAS